jgi:hypothetical protein
MLRLQLLQEESLASSSTFFYSMPRQQVCHVLHRDAMLVRRYTATSTCCGAGDSQDTFPRPQNLTCWPTMYAFAGCTSASWSLSKGGEEWGESAGLLCCSVGDSPSARLYSASMSLEHPPAFAGTTAWIGNISLTSAAVDQHHSCFEQLHE